MKQLLEAIKVKFETRLQEKTGWGRNEIIRAYNDCVTEALLEHSWRVQSPKGND